VEPFEPDPKLLEALATLTSRRWSGIVWRHTFADNPPHKANGRGARWNPPGVEALYTSVDRETALAEADHQMAVQPLRPRARRMLHRVEVHFTSVLDLSDAGTLATLGADAAALQGDDHRPLRAIGGAAAFLGYQALIVPSARHGGSNLVIFPTNEGAMDNVHFVGSEVLDGRQRSAGS
jgi:RES domain-containing protein